MPAYCCTSHLILTESVQPPSQFLSSHLVSSPGLGAQGCLQDQGGPSWPQEAAATSPPTVWWTSSRRGTTSSSWTTLSTPSKVGEVRGMAAARPGPRVSEGNCSEGSDIPESLNRVQNLTGKKLTFYEVDLCDKAALKGVFSKVSGTLTWSEKPL